MTTIDLTDGSFADALRCALSVAAKDDPRSALNAVHWSIAPGALVLTATNGYSIVEITLLCETDACAAALLPRDQMRALLRTFDSLYMAISLSITPGGTWQIAIDDRVALTILPAQVATPNYPHIWEKSAQLVPANEATFDSWLLRRLLKYAPAYVRVQVGGARDLMLLTGKNFRAAIMPTVAQEAADE